MERSSLSGIIFSAAIACLSFSAHAVNDYHVAATVIADGQVLGTPSMLVSGGKEASVSVSGDNGYELAITITSDNANSAMAETSLSAAGRTIEPSVMVILGEQTGVKDGALELKLTVESAADDQDDFMPPP
jgi:hypothetical protein